MAEYRVKLEFANTKANNPKEAIEDLIVYLSDLKNLRGCIWEVEDEATGDELMIDLTEEEEL